MIFVWNCSVLSIYLTLWYLKRNTILLCFLRKIKRYWGSQNSSRKLVEPIRTKNQICISVTGLQGITGFNLSNRILSESEIRVLEKGLDLAPIQKDISEPELRRDLQFCRPMRIKCNLPNETSENFNEFLSFNKVKSTWKLPMRHPNLEVKQKIILN